MSAVIHYRFKTATETNSLRFDGNGLRVFDIKVRRRESGVGGVGVGCGGYRCAWSDVFHSFRSFRLPHTQTQTHPPTHPPTTPLQQNRAPSWRRSGWTRAWTLTSSYPTHRLKKVRSRSNPSTHPPIFSHQQPTHKQTTHPPTPPLVYLDETKLIDKNSTVSSLCHPPIFSHPPAHPPTYPPRSLPGRNQAHRQELHRARQTRGRPTRLCGPAGEAQGQHPFDAAKYVCRSGTVGGWVIGCFCIGGGGR